MTEEQVKPLIEIKFTDQNDKEVLEYVCDFRHLIINLNEQGIPTNTTEKLKNSRDKIIHNKKTEEEDKYIKSAIDETRENFAENISDYFKNQEVYKYENIEEEIENLEYSWSIKILNFNKYTILRDITKYGNEVTFTSENFKYVGNRKEFEVLGEEIHISKVEGSELLQTLEVEWEPYETVGTVISRARRQYDAESS